MDTDDLPLMTLDEVRDQVREGSERVIWWFIHTHANVFRENFLATLREFTERELFVADENDTPIARLQEPSSPPFPEAHAMIREECLKHMQDIRNRSGTLLNSIQSYGPDMSFFISGCLIDIERVIQRIRNQFEVTLYRFYIQDIPMDDETGDQLRSEAENAFEIPKNSLAMLEQSMRMFMKHKQSSQP